MNIQPLTLCEFEEILLEIFKFFPLARSNIKSPGELEYFSPSAILKYVQIQNKEGEASIFRIETSPVIIDGLSYKFQFSIFGESKGEIRVSIFPALFLEKNGKNIASYIDLPSILENCQDEDITKILIFNLWCFSF
jgi:hypothetical protein